LADFPFDGHYALTRRASRGIERERSYRAVAHTGSGSQAERPLLKAWFRVGKGSGKPLP